MIEGINEHSKNKLDRLVAIRFPLYLFTTICTPLTIVFFILINLKVILWSELFMQIISHSLLIVSVILIIMDFIILLCINGDTNENVREILKRLQNHLVIAMGKQDGEMRMAEIASEIHKDSEEKEIYFIVSDFSIENEAAKQKLDDVLKNKNITKKIIFTKKDGAKNFRNHHGNLENCHLIQYNDDERFGLTADDIKKIRAVINNMTKKFLFGFYFETTNPTKEGERIEKKYEGIVFDETCNTTVNFYKIFIKLFDELSNKKEEVTKNENNRRDNPQKQKNRKRASEKLRIG